LLDVLAAMARPKLVIVSLDAAESSLLTRWAASGDLPCLANLLSCGAVASLSTPPAVLEGAIWPTIITGTSPASHGMFSSLQIVPGTYKWRAGVTAARLPYPPFWAHLSDAGVRTIAVDIPFAKPVRHLKGLQLCNWGAHDSWSYPRSSWPAELLPDVVSRFGDHPVTTCDVGPRSPRDFAVFKSCLITGVQKKTALLRHLMAREPWDLFFAVFSESHCVGHQAWHLTDPTHPRYRPGTPETLKTIVHDVYQAIDKGIGRLLERVPDGTSVLVMSSHGMGPWYAGSHLIAPVLERLEMGGHVGAMRQEIWKAGQALAPQTRKRLKAGWLGQAVNGLWHWTHRNPMRRMRAFAVPSNNMTGAIRINLKGREPAGLVAPGREYDRLCFELAQAFLELENPDTGRRAVQWVARASDLYRGPRLNEFPDLFIEWDHSAPITALRSLRIGEVHDTLAVARSGDHRAGGLLVGVGPAFRRGTLADCIRTMDLAPTVLDYFGVPAPAVMEGASQLARLTVPSNGVAAAYGQEMAQTPIGV
jgi:predicted AlkP superfamily phosphohydrolase/phosphomutase